MSNTVAVAVKAMKLCDTIARSIIENECKDTMIKAWDDSRVIAVLLCGIPPETSFFSWDYLEDIIGTGTPEDRVFRLLEAAPEANAIFNTFATLPITKPINHTGDNPMSKHTSERDRLMSQTVDYVTCINCQADLEEVKHEHGGTSEWTYWLVGGCCCPECYSPLLSDEEGNK